MTECVLCDAEFMCEMAAPAVTMGALLQSQCLYGSRTESLRHAGVGMERRGDQGRSEQHPSQCLFQHRRPQRPSCSQVQLPA